MKKKPSYQKMAFAALWLTTGIFIGLFFSRSTSSVRDVPAVNALSRPLPSGPIYQVYQGGNQPLIFPLSKVPESMTLIEEIQDFGGTGTRFIFKINQEQAMEEVRKQFEMEDWTLEYSDRDFYSGYPGQDFEAVLNSFPYIFTDRFVNDSRQAEVYYMYSGKETQTKTTKSLDALRVYATDYSRTIGSLEQIEIAFTSQNDGKTSTTSFFVPSQSFR